MSSSTSNLKRSIVRAGAGAGKTTELTKKVLSLAEDFKKKNNRYPRLVVTTFTRKATQELRERLMGNALKENSKDLFSYVQKPSSLHVSTIHGVLSLFLSKYASFINLSSQFQMIGLEEEFFQIKKITRDLARSDSDFAKDFQFLLETFNFQELIELLVQYSAAADVKRPLIPVKERELQEKVHVYFSEFFKKSWELCKSISNNVDDEKWQSFANSLNERFEVLSKEKDLLKLHKQIVEFSEVVEFPRKNKNVSEDIAEELKDFKSDLEEICEFYCNPEFFGNYAKNNQVFSQLAIKVIEKYSTWKMEIGFLTLSDLEKLSLQLLETPAAELFSNEWDYWMIDEFQDTSPIQIEILNKLIGSKPFYLVGDPQQSIYLFRGARSEIFAETQEKVKAEEGDTPYLQENWRSQPQLLEFFNDLFAAVDKQFHPMSPAEEKQHPKLIEEEVAHIFQVGDSAEDEMKAAVFRCQELYRKGVPFEDICILSRTNKDLKNISRLAKRYSLPVLLHTAGQFYERREVQDALSFLKFLVNPHDNLNLLQLLRSPFFHISDSEIRSLTSKISSSFWGSGVGDSSHEAVARLKIWSKSVNELGLTEAWLQGMIKEGYFDASSNLDSSGRREANLWKLVSLVKQEEKKPGFSPLALLNKLVQIDPENQGEADATPVVQPRRVNLMTINSSKGLQFPYVILLGAGDDPMSINYDTMELETESLKFCLSALDTVTMKKVTSLWGRLTRAQAYQREMSEHWRFLYVALTRAEAGITMIWSKPGKRSWASRFNLKSCDRYQIRTQNSSVEPETMDWAVNKKSTLRAPWIEKQSSMANESVTALLDKSGPGKIERFEKSTQSSVNLVQKAVTGVQIHRLFENIKYQSVETSEFKKELEFIQNWQGGEIVNWIQNGFVEWGFAVKHKERLIQGQIDLWATDSNNDIIIADYKTGSPAGMEKAFDQLGIYAWALQKMKRADRAKQKIKLAVIYPRSGKVEVREAPSQSEIERKLLE